MHCGNPRGYGKTEEGALTQNGGALTQVGDGEGRGREELRL